LITERDAAVFKAALGELAGPYGRVIRGDLGASSEPVFRALRDRLLRRRSEGLSSDEIHLDEVDLAAVRTLVPIILRRHDPGEFATVTRYTFDDLVDLLDRATELIREVRIVAGYITVQHGSCMVQLPHATVARNETLVLAPDAGSWDRVMPACAAGRREEFLQAAQSRFRDRPGFVFEDRTADSLQELESTLTERRRAFLAKKGRAQNP
jgi:hypothetical protein